MPQIATTKMSTKEQVVIPKPIKEIDLLLAKARQAGKEAGLKEIDIQKAIKKVRETK